LTVYDLPFGWYQVSIIKMIYSVVLILLAYLIGSIPFGLLLTKWAGLGDIRAVGSGNIGATNVLRTGKKWLAFVTLVLDFSKAFVPLIIFSSIATDFVTNILQPMVFGELLIAELFCLLTAAIVVGHMFPIWLKFKGGKGVACLFGVFFAYSWILGVIAAALWLFTFFTTRYSSLAALIALPLAPIILEWIAPCIAHDCASAFSFERYGYALSMLSYSLPIPIILMILKHTPNIRRLLKGEEHRFIFKKRAVEK
jgi:glycerol-3-phosphate acyltransferase PlsY